MGVTGNTVEHPPPFSYLSWCNFFLLLWQEYHRGQIQKDSSGVKGEGAGVLEIPHTTR